MACPSVKRRVHDIADGARAAAEVLIAHGATAIRAHVDVGAGTELRALWPLVELRERLRAQGLAELQVVAAVSAPLTVPRQAKPGHAPRGDGGRCRRRRWRATRRCRVPRVATVFLFDGWSARSRAPPSGMASVGRLACGRLNVSRGKTGSAAGTAGARMVTRARRLVMVPRAGQYSIGTVASSSMSIRVRVAADVSMRLISASHGSRA